MKNIFVLGLDPFNRRLLESLPEAEEAVFHGLLDFDEVRGDAEHPVEQLLALCEQRLSRFEDSIDGFIGFLDFPVTLMVPLLCARYDTPGPSFESVVHCEHKLWSRRLQREVIPESVPYFAGFDPFDARPFAGLDLLPPFWIKPVKSFRSYLAFLINDEASFGLAMNEVRRNVRQLSEPFERLLHRIELPEDLTGDQNIVCIAESQLAGSQCTVEGYVFDGEVTVYGVVDSVRELDSSSFHRYEYPSRLPEPVQDRMRDICRRVMPHLAYYHGAFNAEFFYNQTDNGLWLLEINPRHSQSHAYLFEQLHGVANHQVMVQLALGRRPTLPKIQSPGRVAAKFMLRTRTDGFVTDTPSPQERNDLAEDLPDSHLDVLVRPGTRLSNLAHQDSYSYEVADLYLAADSAADLDRAYRHALSKLTFRIAQEIEMALDL